MKNFQWTYPFCLTITEFVKNIKTVGIILFIAYPFFWIFHFSNGVVAGFYAGCMFVIPFLCIFSFTVILHWSLEVDRELKEKARKSLTKV